MGVGRGDGGVSSTKITQWAGLCDCQNMNSCMMYTTGAAGGVCERHKDYQWAGLVTVRI